MKFLRFILRNMLRSRSRTLLTVAGIAVSMFIFAALLGLDGGVRRMLDNTSGEDVLIVFERYKACPPYSNLPVHYAGTIEQLDEVDQVMPVRFLLSNCGTTTDLVAVHGVEPGQFRQIREIEIPDAQYEQFVAERGAAIIGRNLADSNHWLFIPSLQFDDIAFRVRYIHPGHFSSRRNFY